MMHRNITGIILESGERAIKDASRDQFRGNLGPKQRPGPF